MKTILPNIRVRDGLVSIISVALAGIFLSTGSAKVIGFSEMAQDFARWGYPEWLVVVAAALEVTGALLILAPRLASVGALLIATSMTGAFVTHLINAQAGKMALTALLLLSALLVGVARWPRSLFTAESAGTAESADSGRAPAR